MTIRKDYPVGIGLLILKHKFHAAYILVNYVYNMYVCMYTYKV